MIRKSVQRISEKIMLRQQVSATEFGSRDHAVMNAEIACLSIPWTSTD